MMERTKYFEHIFSLSSGIFSECAGRDRSIIGYMLIFTANTGIQRTRYEKKAMGKRQGKKVMRKGREKRE